MDEYKGKNKAIVIHFGPEWTWTVNTNVKYEYKPSRTYYLDDIASVTRWDGECIAIFTKSEGLLVLELEWPENFLSYYSMLQSDGYPECIIVRGKICSCGHAEDLARELNSPRHELRRLTLRTQTSRMLIALARKIQSYISKV